MASPQNIDGVVTSDDAALHRDARVARGELRRRHVAAAIARAAVDDAKRPDAAAIHHGVVIPAAVGERPTARVLLQYIHKEIDMMKEDIRALIQSMNDMVTSSDSLSVKDE